VISRLLMLAISVIIALILINMAVAQETPNGEIIPNEDSLTVLFNGNGIISLEGLCFEGNQPHAILLEEYDTFENINFNAIPLPICFRLERDGENGTIPQGCQNVLVHSLNDNDVFWVDRNDRAVIAFTLGICAASQPTPPPIQVTPLVICGAGQNSCSFNYPQPIPSHTPTTIPSPTVTYTDIPTSTLSATITPIATLTLTFTPTITSTFLPTPQPTITVQPSPTPIGSICIADIYITTPSIIMRDGPALTASTLDGGVLNAGTNVEVLAEDGNWSRIRRNEGLEGWIETQFLRCLIEPTAIPQCETPVLGVVIANTTEELILRAQPESDAEAVHLLPPRTTVDVLGQSEDGLWLYIQEEIYPRTHQCIKGWGLAEYFTTSS